MKTLFKDFLIAFLVGCLFSGQTYAIKVRPDPISGQVIGFPVFMENDVIEAKDYGVVADGTTDDKTALNNAWNAVIALPKGGILQLPSGTIYLSTKWSPTQPGTGKSVWIRGAGRDSTIFKFDTTNGNNSYIMKFAGS